LSIVKELSTDQKTLEELLQQPSPSASGIRVPGDPAKQKLELLLKVSESLSSPEAAGHLPDQIVRLLPQMLEVERAVLVMVDEGDGQLAVVASHSEVKTDSPGMFSRQIATHVLEKKVAVLSLDAKTDERFAASGSISAQHIRATMCAPLRGRSAIMGVLYADNVTHAGMFGEEDLKLLAGFANQAAIALENAALSRRIVEEARAREAELTRLVEERTKSLREALAEAETQRGRAQEAQEVAEEANRVKGRFLASMSHELRTPLGAILGYTDLLKDTARDIGGEEMLPDFEKIESAANHLMSVINDILDFSKVEAGKMALFVEEFDLARVLREVQDTVQPLVGRKSNVLEVRFPADIGSVRNDETRVRQVLFNLLSNASKFTEKGTIVLDASRGAGADGSDRLRLAVTDSGIGMTEAQLQKLFQAFTQADESTSKKYGGTGLGLTLCRQFCRMMGGDISVSSVYGQGTTFTVDIPSAVAVEMA
jgi:signal transduction histidine kinase